MPPKAAPCLACGNRGPEGFKKECILEMKALINRGKLLCLCVFEGAAVILGRTRFMLSEVGMGI